MTDPVVLGGGAEAPGCASVGDLLRTIWKSARAFQMYLPNNPMFQRARETLQEAFVPVWEVADEVALTIVETDMFWDGDLVYSQSTRSESFAWSLYKDGMRHLTLRRGVEEKEIFTFLNLVGRARVLAADAGDDLLTLLWEQDFEFLSYHFAEVVTDMGVLDPQALDLEAVAAPEEVRERVRQDPAPPARVPGVVDLDEFDSTLYFLDDGEVQALRRQVAQEYSRDIRSSALDIVLDILELQEGLEARREAIEIFDTLFPNLLTQGQFSAVARLLREFQVARKRASNLQPDLHQRLEGFEVQLSSPAIVTQLVQAMDESGSSLAEGGIVDLIGVLRPPALEPILAGLPTMADEEVKRILEAAADRLAATDTEGVLRLLRVPDSPARLALVQLCGRLQLQAAVPGLADLLSAPEPPLRAAAVTSLGQIGSPGALGALEPALEDAEREVRLAAVEVVREKGFKGALSRLESVVRGKSRLTLERSERLQYFEAYAEVAGPSGLDALTRVLEPRGWIRRRAPADIRTCAVYALGRIRTPEARAVLERNERDKELSVRNAVSRILRGWPA